MAQRRMFSLKIIDTDSFLDMSPTAQLLYFHLSMRADDDGFVSSPKKILKMVGTGEDDMKILIAKKFIIPFESGVCVIKDWKIHNYIQADRYQETHYLNEKSQLNENENGAYEIQCIQNVYKMDTQVRLGKVRLGKVNNIINAETSSASPLVDDLTTDTADQVAKKPAKPKEPPNPAFKEIVDFYFEEIKARYRVKPEFGKAGGQRLNQIIPKYPAKDIKEMIAYYLDSKKVDEHGFSLKVALSEDSINKYLQNG